MPSRHARHIVYIASILGHPTQISIFRFDIPLAPPLSASYFYFVAAPLSHSIFFITLSICDYAVSNYGRAARERESS